MPSEKNVVREGGLWKFKSRCLNVGNIGFNLKITNMVITVIFNHVPLTLYLHDWYYVQMLFAELQKFIKTK